LNVRICHFAGEVAILAKRLFNTPISKLSRQISERSKELRNTQNSCLPCDLYSHLLNLASIPRAGIANWAVEGGCVANQKAIDTFGLHKSGNT
jgi:hypothetical protein